MTASTRHQLHHQTSAPQIQPSVGTTSNISPSFQRKVTEKGKGDQWAVIIKCLLVYLCLSAEPWVQPKTALTKFSKRRVNLKLLETGIIKKLWDWIERAGRKIFDLLSWDQDGNVVEVSPGCSTHHGYTTPLFYSCNGVRVMAMLRGHPSSDAAAAPLGSQDTEKKKLENYFY